MTALPAAAQTQALAVIGETPETPNGYTVRVSSVRFPGKGMRVRLEMLKCGEFIRHLDITSEIAKHLWSLLRDAVDLGAP